MTFDRVEFNDTANIAIRWVKDDGGFHRGILCPGDDLSSLPDSIQQQIQDHWTPERVAAWQAMNEEP